MSNEILDQGIQATNASDTIGNLPIRLPKDSSILTTGIVALPFSLGFIGPILAIITLVNASKATKTYNENPEKYLVSSAKKVRAGKVCAIISLSIFVVAVIIVLAVNA